MKRPFPLYILILLSVCTGCALHGPSQVGLYPCSGYYSDEPIEGGDWQWPENSKFDETEAEAVLLPALFAGVNPGEASVSNSLYSSLDIVAYTKLPGGTEHARSASAVAVKAVTVNRSRDHMETVYTLVYVAGGLLGSAHLLSGSGDESCYSLSLIPSKFEYRPLVLLFRDEGGNTRSFSYELYRIEREDLRLLWKWDEDGYSPSLTEGYTYSNLGFSGLTSGKANEIGVYTTEGQGRLMDGMTQKDLIPHYKRSIFSWNASTQRFELRSTRAAKPLVGKPVGGDDP